MAQTPLVHTPLFNARLIKRSMCPDATPTAQKKVLDDWGQALRSGAIRGRNEQQIRLIEAASS